jgi:beta-lactamase regulating signal transducer with metallopeptidase domain
MAEFAQLAAVQAMATALLHFLWQGSLIALAAAVLMRVARTAAVRYAVGIGALVAMLAAPAATFALQLDTNVSAISPAASGPAPLNPVPEILVDAEPAGLPGFSTIDAGLWPVAGVFAWMTGMVILSVRLAGGWFIARRMTTRAVRPAAAHVQAAAAVLAEKLALRRVVRVLESSAVAVPVLVGWLKPAVVLPVAALAGLSPAQIEALLAHELAHVHRHDYLVNLLQSFAEVVLFYHPAVWWLSRRVRTERELCCDDLAVGLCDRLVYATALTDLAAMRAPRVALAATGGDLLTRVRRILGREEPSMSSNARWIPAVAVAAVTLAAVPALVASVRTGSAPNAELPGVPSLAASAIPGINDPIANPSAEPEQVGEQSAAQERERVPTGLRTRLEELRALLVARAAELNDQAIGFAEFQAIGEQDQKAREVEERARQAMIESARQELQRMHQMFETGLVSRSQLVDAEAALAMAEAGTGARRRQDVEIAAVKRQIEDARRRYEVGLLSKDDLARFEAELASMQASGNLQKKAELQMLEHEQRFANARELYSRGLLSTAQVRDAERLFQEAEQKYMERQAKEKAVESKIKDVEKQKELEQKYKEMLVEFEKAKGAQDKEFEKQLKEVSQASEKSKLHLTPPQDPKLFADAVLEPVASRPIEVGDFLFITIDGEWQLPTIYRIENEGSIRVPLLGSFRVLGQTPGQVREAIGKGLMNAKLGSPSKVHVEIRRER